MEQKLILNSDTALRKAINLLTTLRPQEPMQLQIKPWSPPRTLSANALYWKWMAQLSAHLSTPGQQEYSKDDLHDICRHKFLGYRSSGKRMADGTPLYPQLKSTTELSKSEMCHYMTQIDSWAISMNCLLPSPDDSEYKRFTKKQEVAA